MQAKKHLGQHFLVDGRVIDRIIRSIVPSTNETIVEIGAGRGALTSSLVDSVGHLVAIEVDADLSPFLQECYGVKKNFTLIQESALTLDLCESILPSSTTRIVANLPYYISTAILQRLIEQRVCITEMFLMLQREVANRIRATPGSSARGYLSVLVQAHCETDVLLEVPPESFRPIPKVWSAFLRLRFRSEFAEIQDPQISWELVSVSFRQRRKTILNNLRSAPKSLLHRIVKAGGPICALEESGVDPRRRAETLTIGEWARLSKRISRMDPK